MFKQGGHVSKTHTVSAEEVGHTVKSSEKRREIDGRRSTYNCVMNAILKRETPSDDVDMILMVSKETNTDFIVQGVENGTQTDSILYSEEHVHRLQEEIAECRNAICRITMERDNALTSDARTYQRLRNACKSAVKREEVHMNLMETLILSHQELERLKAERRSEQTSQLLARIPDMIRLLEANCCPM